MTKVVGVAALLASSLLGVLGGGFSSNGEMTPGGRCHLDAVSRIFSHLTLNTTLARLCHEPPVSSCHAQLAQLASRSGREWTRSVHQHMQAGMRLLPGKSVADLVVVRRRRSSRTQPNATFQSS